MLVFHGYLLRGTGSNVYNASLARALVAQGHEVHLLCQEREAEEIAWVDAVGTWSGGSLQVEVRRRPVRLTVYRPDIGSLLPVYVADSYEGFDARPFTELSDAELDFYARANVAAVKEVAELVRPDAALANHEVMGPVILARALQGSVGYAVKSHGSALEYTVAREPERYAPLAREGMAGAGGVLVGSRHTADRLWEVLGRAGIEAKTRLGPPGVDTAAFRPRAPAEAARALRALAERLGERAAVSFGGDAGAGAALRALDPTRDRMVTFVGKLIAAKGVDLLLAAWPLVVAEVPDARLCVVGFGAGRPRLERLLGALADGDLTGARQVAAGSGSGEDRALVHLLAFFDGLSGARADAYRAAAPAAAGRVHLTGRLEHEDLPDLLAAAEAQVVPSTFPEAFGMVAVEAAACGALPVVAAHSGLAEASAELAAGLPEAVRQLLTFRLGPRAVEEIAARLLAWFALDAAERARTREQLARLAHSRYGWERVAEEVLAAARGRLDELRAVPVRVTPSGSSG